MSGNRRIDEREPPDEAVSACMQRLWFLGEIRGALRDPLLWDTRLIHELFTAGETRRSEAFLSILQPCSRLRGQMRTSIVGVEIDAHQPCAVLFELLPSIMTGFFHERLDCWNMLERARSFQGLGVVHGFTTRQGGVSHGRHATLNLGKKWGDDPDAVAENVRRVAQAGGFAREDLCTVKQVHGNIVLRARDLEPASEADALWTHRDDGSRIVAVLTADCVPILLVDQRCTVACAIHSGWRGTVAGIVTNAVRTLREAGISPGELFAAIGPCIERDAFEVGEEVADEFEEAFVVRPAAHAGRSKTRPHVDLVAACRDQLVKAGVQPTSIERVGGCTHTHVERYFSYRRDGAGTGQMMSFIGFTR